MGWVALAMWALLLVASGTLVFDIKEASLSLDNLLAVSAVLVFGLAPALWIVTIGVISSEVVRTLLAERLRGPRRTGPRTLVVAATNVSLQVFSLLAGWLAFYAVGGRVPLIDFSARAILSLGVMFASYFLANNLLFSINVKIEEGTPIRRTLWEDWRVVVLFDLLPLPLSIVIAEVYTNLGVWSFMGLAIYLLVGMVMVHNLNRAVASQAAIAQENARLVHERERRITDLSILNEISRSLSSALNLGELLEVVHRQVSRIFDTTNFYIATYEQGSDEWAWDFEIEHGQRQPVTRHKIGTGLTGYIILNRKSLLFCSGADVNAFREEQGVTRVGEPAQSWMGVPLIAADEVVGVMAIQSYAQENLYTEQDLGLFFTIGAQVAIAIRNARLYAETQRRADEATSLLNQIQEALESKSQLLATIEEMGTPMIPVAAGIVVLPLIGHIDPQRAQNIMENLLAGIAAHQAQVVLIDITGVPTVDTLVASSLMQAARAANLLGTRVMLVGIRPEVAQTIVHLGVDMKGIANFANLQAGIEAALAMRGLKIVQGRLP